jgi:membrane fusion protein (multidrug efflux system)
MNEFAPKPTVVAATIMTDGIEIQPATKPHRRIGRRQLILGPLGLLALVAAGLYADHYWKVGRFLESTDDAYVKSDFTIVAPKVSGYIDQVLVADNQAVTAGQVLARIDDSDYQTALAQAKADVASAEADVRNIEAQLLEQQSVIEQAQAAIAADQASVTFTTADYKRYHDLTARQVTSVQDEQRARTALQQAQAELQRDRAGLTAAKQRIDVLNTAKMKAKTEILRLQAVQKQAELNLGYTTIIAPIDGTVGARSLRVGQFVQAGTQLMAVVPLHAVYVVANFKETQLSRMRPGQPVSIEVDSYPGIELSGHVDSVSPASGLEFALLPPDNATGNFTKIVQRVPVKIVLDQGELSGNLLKAGMSVEPTVNTKMDVRS